MSVHLIFAENLRHACTAHPSIASVCNGIGINRQQFNKYLAGSALPNAITLRKICGFLRMQEQTLFLKSGAHSDVLVSRSASTRLFADDGVFGRHINGLMHFDVQNVSPGSYYCYFPLQNAPGMLLRSLVIIKASDHGLEFSRFTVFPASKGTAKYLMAGKHRGLVMSNGNEFYLLGVNVYTPKQMTLMVLDRSKVGDGFLSGMLITRGGTDQIATRVCMIRQNSVKSLRSMIGELGFLHQQKSDLKPIHLADLMRNPSAI